jgi:hypothetical protein
MLTLFDPTLVYIDPYDPTINELNKQKVIREIFRNPWYFLREVVRIPLYKNIVEPYKADLANTAQTWCILNNINSWLSKSRGRYKTGSNIAILLWYYLTKDIYTEIDLMGMDPSASKWLFDSFAYYILALPEYISKNMNSQLCNGIVTKTIAQYNENYNDPRMLSMYYGNRYHFFDDASFINDITPEIMKITYYRNVNLHFRPTDIIDTYIFTSVKSKKNTNGQQFEKYVIDNSIKFSETIYDEAIDDLKSEVSSTNSGILYIKYTWKELGLSQEWYEEMHQWIHDPETFAREIELIDE